jgi:hypothetical protein
MTILLVIFYSRTVFRGKISFFDGTDSSLADTELLDQGTRWNASRYFIYVND